MDHAEKVMRLVPISEMVDKMQPVGSRVTCNPAPTDTDEDYLLLIPDDGGDEDAPAWTKYNNLTFYLHQNGWERGGSLVAGDVDLPAEARFESYTLGHLNLIVTMSSEFYRRFMAATYVAKRLNLLNKPDRIALFQAVLYGNIVEEES